MPTQREIDKARREALMETWVVRLVIAAIVAAILAVFVIGIMDDTSSSAGPENDDPSIYYPGTPDGSP